MQASAYPRRSPESDRSVAQEIQAHTLSREKKMAKGGKCRVYLLQFPQRSATPSVWCVVEERRTHLQDEQGREKKDEKEGKHKLP